MVGFFLFLLSFANAETCNVHALKALENPASLNVKEKPKIPDASQTVANLAKEFGLTLASVCSGQPCGIDPKVDQDSREHVVAWVKKAEKLKEADQKVLKTLIRDWIKVEIRYLFKEGWKPEQVSLRKSRISFFDARLVERKSSMKDLFCLD